jgi:ferredoxin-type protein NapF
VAEVALSVPPRPLRRAFLRGAAVAAPARSPYAAPEAAFLDLCTRCDACVSACPETVLRHGDGGYPTLRFDAGECSFCAACVDACPTPALDQVEHRAWTWRARIDDACLATRGIVCRSCADACGQQAIRFAPQQGMSTPVVDAVNCSGCGACVGACPSSAVVMHEAQPA